MAFRCNALCKLAFIFLLLSGTVVQSLAEETMAVGDHETSSQAEEIDAEDLASDNAPTEKAHVVSSLSAGYRIIDTAGYGGRAAEYEYLHSSPVFGASLYRLGKELKYSLEGTYLNRNEYVGDFLFDYMGDYRLHLRMDSLYHNLDREQLPDLADLARAPNPLGAAYSVSPDPVQRYGIRAEQDTATFRYKIKDFPFHLNLGYWRMYRDGARQLIFADQAFEGPTNILYAVRRPVKNQVQEGTMGFDTHLGPIDLIYRFQIRQFEDRSGIPAAEFVARPDLAGNLVRNAGIQQHNEDPDSRYMQHTVKLHTSLAGGIVGAASYSYGLRENLSSLSDIGGVGRTSAALHNAAADLVYTPCRQFSLALKYRLQQVDNDSPATITSRYSVQPDVTVRPSIDLFRNTLTATMSFRPVNLVTFIGEYKGDFLHRDSSAMGTTAAAWRDLPENSDIHKGTFSIISRPVKGLRLKALYSYSTTDQPSYGTSFAERHEGKFLATYNSASRWGFTAGYHATRANNDGISRSVIIQPLTDNLTFGPNPYPLSRDKSDSRVSASVWVSPLEKLTVTASYSFVRTSIDQAVLLTGIAPAIQDASNFSSQSHIYAINALYNLSERTNFTVLLQQVYSRSEFAPAYFSDAVSASSTSGISDLSRTKTVESTVSARSDFSITDTISCVLDYSFRDYNDRVSSVFDGTVQTYMVFLNAKW